MSPNGGPPGLVADVAPESETFTRRLAGAGSDLAACLEVLTAAAVSLLSAEGAVAGRIVAGAFRVESAAGSLIPMVGFHAPLVGSLATEAVDRGCVLVLNEARGDERVEAHFLAAFTPRQVAVAPMMVENTGRGFLLAINSARGTFTAEDSLILQRLADHGAIAVRHGELCDRLQERAAESRKLCDVVQQMNQSLEVERVQAVLARYSAEMLHARGARVALLEGGKLIVAATYGDASDAVGTAVDPGRVFAGDALRLGRPQRTSDVRLYADQWARTVDARDSGSGEGRPNAVTAPLLIGGRAIGAVTVFGNEHRDFTEDDEALLLSLATPGAVAIENALQYRAAAHTARRANTLAVSARALAFSTTPEAVYAGIARVARDDLGAEGFTVVLADADGGPLTLAHAEGAGRAVAWTAERFWRVTPGQVAASGVPRYLSTMEPAFAELTEAEAAAFRAGSIRSAALLPLRCEGGQRGVLILRFGSPRRFDERERDLMEAFATQVALAIRNAQLIAAERTGRERERALAEAMHQTEKLAALGELVAGVAHELNNPLTGISTFAQLLLDEPLDEEQREAVNTIKVEADRAVGVIRDLLMYSRKSGPRAVAVDLNALVQQTLRLRGYSLQSAGVAVETALDPALPQIWGDDQRLQQVVLNLLVNAEHAMQRNEERRLTIRTRQEGIGALGRAIIEVSDSGTGMPADLLKHIFEPFFTTKPAGIGTGLGLSVSYGIVQAHGGGISARSTPGEGSTFTVALPLHHPAPSPDRALSTHVR